VDLTFEGGYAMSAANPDWIPASEAPGGEWQNSLPLQSELPSVESIKEELLPGSLRPLVCDVAE
jgi:hypothetical protein